MHCAISFHLNIIFTSFLPLIPYFQNNWFFGTQQLSIHKSKKPRMMPKRPRLDDDNNDGKSPPSKDNSHEAQQPPTSASSEEVLRKFFTHTRYRVDCEGLDAESQALFLDFCAKNPKAVTPIPPPQNVEAMDVGAASSSQNTVTKDASSQKIPSSAEKERYKPEVVKLSGKLVRIIDDDPDEEQGELRLELVEPEDEIAERVGEAEGERSDSQ
ncbi:unnamed protein product [Caenorhabditis brenneri]